jgi:hypothetical protein
LPQERTTDLTKESKVIYESKVFGDSGEQVPQYQGKYELVKACILKNAAGCHVPSLV